MFITLYKIGELHFRLLGTNGFHVKAKSERFTAASSRCCQNLKYGNFMHVVVWQTTSKHCTKERAARAARLFSFIQPIKSLICGVDVAVVKYLKTPTGYGTILVQHRVITHGMSLVFVHSLWSRETTRSEGCSLKKLRENRSPQSPLRLYQLVNVFHDHSAQYKLATLLLD